MPTDAWTSCCSARRNGLVASSRRDGRRHGRLAGGAQLRDFSARASAIAFSGSIVSAKRALACGIFVAAIDLRSRPAASASLHERIPHHRHRRLEHAAAAERKQRVAAERDLVLLEPIGDMAGGMARASRSPWPRARRHGQSRPRPRRRRARRCARLPWPDRRCAISGKRALRPGMPWVWSAWWWVISSVGQRPALRLRGGDHRLGVRRVDRRGRARARIVDENAVIVLQAQKLINMRRHGALYSRGGWRFVIARRGARGYVASAAAGKRFRHKRFNGGRWLSTSAISGRSTTRRSARCRAG